ncbi:MAG: peptidylprolyl isomerase [Pirellulaceae bacterium]
MELDTTQGKILLDLDPSVAPEHCRNMIGLARSGYYDNLSFHRVIEGFMIQGGCNRGDGTGGPGYMIRAEFNDTRHEPGVLSMARSSNPNSAGAQFFICLAAHSHLDGQYTAFGRTANAEPRGRQQDRRARYRLQRPATRTGDHQHREGDRNVEVTHR